MTNSLDGRAQAASILVQAQGAGLIGRPRTNGDRCGDIGLHSASAQIAKPGAPAPRPGAGRMRAHPRVCSMPPLKNGDNQRMAISIPSRLVATCRKSAERSAWLDQLPDTLRNLEGQWSLMLETPFDTEDVSCAWVVPARLVNGSSAVLKVPMPHMEAEHELEGLRFWNGDPTVRVLFADDRTGAMLLERCEPGTPLRELPESDQDVVITGILRRLWRSPSAPHPFRRRAAGHFPTGPPLVIGRRRRDGAARIAGRLSRAPWRTARSARQQPPDTMRPASSAEPRVNRKCA